MRFLNRSLRLSALILVVLTVTYGSGRAQKIWTLEDCINYALENNLEIHRQVYTVESNKEALLQSGLNMLPGGCIE